MTHLKINYMSKIFLIIILLLISIFFLSYGGITGFNAVDVSIKEKTQGAILLDYNYNVNLTSAQSITAEFVNTGTSNYTARIEITVYMYNNTTGNLQELANYYDSYFFLLPGGRKSFKTVFLPNRIGAYYIKVKVPYDLKIAELWGSFFVTFYYPYEQPAVITVPPSLVIPSQIQTGIAGLNLIYKDKIDLYPGQKTLIDITVNNTGTINLHNLKFYSTTTGYISFEVNPKEIYELENKEYNIFLVSLELSKDIPAGEYDFFFEVLGLEARKTGNIKLNVTSVVKPIKDGRFMRQF